MALIIEPGSAGTELAVLNIERSSGVRGAADKRKSRH